MRNYWYSLGLLLAAALPAACGASAPPAGMPVSTLSPLLEQPLPELNRPTVGGPRLDAESLRGRVVVVKFFAEYCRPCQRTLPQAEAIHESSDDVVVVGISLDEDARATMRQIARYHLTFPVIHDRGRMTAGRFRVTELPMTFVADRSHHVVWVGGPGTTHAMLRQAVAAALEQPSERER